MNTKDNISSTERDMEGKHRILFLCLGNICRSAAAEGIMKEKVAAAGREGEFEIDSAGLIDYHEGELADPRMRKAAARRGIRLTHRSRPIRQADFQEFDLIVAMDEDNVRRLKRIMPPDARARVVTASRYFQKDWGRKDVPDPYYSDERGFEFCLDQLDDVCEGMLKSFQNN